MTTEKVSETIKKNGGARPGAGRPKGSGNKITIQTLLEQCAIHEEPFEIAFAKDWAASKGTPDRVKYNQFILNKVMADRQQIEIDETTTAESRQSAFLKALEIMGNVATEHDSANGTK